MSLICMSHVNCILKLHSNPDFSVSFTFYKSAYACSKLWDILSVSPGMKGSRNWSWLHSCEQDGNCMVVPDLTDLYIYGSSVFLVSSSLHSNILTCHTLCWGHCLIRQIYWQQELKSFWGSSSCSIAGFQKKAMWSAKDMPWVFRANVVQCKAFVLAKFPNRNTKSQPCDPYKNFNKCKSTELQTWDLIDFPGHHITFYHFAVN